MSKGQSKADEIKDSELRGGSSNIKSDVPAEGTTDEQERLRDAGYMAPDNGPFRCDNCEYFSHGHCKHPDVNAPVEAGGCCAFFDPIEKSE